MLHFPTEAAPQFLYKLALFIDLSVCQSVCLSVCHSVRNDEQSCQALSCKSTTRSLAQSVRTSMINQPPD